jgi:hypothetical protein
MATQRTKFRFLSHHHGVYTWVSETPKPGDSAQLHVTCKSAWFWDRTWTPPKAFDDQGDLRPTMSIGQFHTWEV